MSTPQRRRKRQADDFSVGLDPKNTTTYLPHHTNTRARLLATALSSSVQSLPQKLVSLPPLDTVSYYDHLDEMRTDSVQDVALWLLIDRGIARHNRVAAGKLWEHDTYRVVEDDNGVVAIGKCPLPGITVRVGAMLSLLRDLGLLGQKEGRYTATHQCKGFMEEQLDRDWS
jgi:hypothetical protein